MEYVNRVPLIPNPQVLNTFPNGWHGLEVLGLLATLYSLALVTHIVPRILREIP